MLVTNINQAGTAVDGNGISLRLKTAIDRGGLLQNITYQNICMQNHRTLISITPLYNTNSGTLIPQFQNITFRNVHGLTNGKMSIAGYDANHLTTLNLDNFVFDNLTAATISPPFTFDTITLGPGPVSPAFLQSLTGTGVTFNGSVTSPTTAPYACSASTFTFLVGELYLSTSTSTNLSTVTVPGPGTVTLNAMLQPAMSQVTYMSSTGTAAPTAPGATGTAIVTAAPAIGFAGAVGFSCSSPVAYVTCSLNPASQTVSGTTSVQSTITVNVASTVSELEPKDRGRATGLVSYAFCLPLGFFALIGFTVKRKHGLPLLAALCVLAATMSGISGCGGGSKPPTTTETAPSGTQVITVTAKSAATTQTIQLTVNIGS